MQGVVNVGSGECRSEKCNVCKIQGLVIVGSSDWRVRWLQGLMNARFDKCYVINIQGLMIKGPRGMLV